MWLPAREGHCGPGGLGLCRLPLGWGTEAGHWFPLRLSRPTRLLPGEVPVWTLFCNLVTRPNPGRAGAVLGHSGEAPGHLFRLILDGLSRYFHAFRRCRLARLCQRPAAPLCPPSAAGSRGEFTNMESETRQGPLHRDLGRAQNRLPVHRKVHARRPHAPGEPRERPNQWCLERQWERPAGLESEGTGGPVGAPLSMPPHLTSWIKTPTASPGPAPIPRLGPPPSLPGVSTRGTPAAESARAALHPAPEWLLFL